MATQPGIAHWPILGTPIGVIDFETTGLAAGFDRVVEISVVRLDPGGMPEIVLNTLVNPMRPMAATEIHGITDEDVADAPCFRDVASEVVRVLSGCVVAAYNVYFDIKFLNFELQNVGVDHEPPHFCLMYLRPMLGLGPRCRLDVACRKHGIAFDTSHVAASDAIASARLLATYFDVMRERQIKTYGELAKLKRYKFVQSFKNDPFSSSSSVNLGDSAQTRPRSAPASTFDHQRARRPLAAYWDTLRTVLADLEITDEEVEHVNKERASLGLTKEEIRAMHAKAFASVISHFVEDKWLDDREVRKLRRLHNCLARLGWAPGT